MAPSPDALDWFNATAPWMQLVQKLSSCSRSLDCFLGVRSYCAGCKLRRAVGTPQAGGCRVGSLFIKLILFIIFLID